MTELSPEFAAALVKALGPITKVTKGADADMFGGYKYADLGDIVDATRPALAAEGIIALTPFAGLGDMLTVRVLLIHESGQTHEFDPLVFPHGQNAQATGSMVTYYRRYALLAALGLAAGEPNVLADPGDDDGAQAQPQARVPGFRSSVVAAVAKLTDAEKLQLRTWCLEHGIPNVPAEMDQGQCEAVTEWIMALPADG